MPARGRLYVVAVPIGDPGDVTLRALETLRSVDAVVCEELREGSTLLKRLGIVKDLHPLNEHNQATAAPELARRLEQGAALALISDCGTPVFSDPGHTLVAAAVRAEVPVIPIPGPSSLTAALSLCDFKVERFLYEGFLPRQKERRRQRLRQLRAARAPVVLMDAPYRLREVLAEVADSFGPEQRVILACDLTLPTERVYRGAVQSVRAQLDQQKCEFVLIIG